MKKSRKSSQNSESALPPAKNQAAVELAKKRSEKLSPERRSEIAKKAAEAKWKGTTKAERRKGVAAANEARRKKPEKSSE